MVMSRISARLATCACTCFLIACDTGDVDVRVTAIVPAEIPTVSSAVLRASLWVHDPMLADAPASLADADSLRFSHQSGTATELRLRVKGHVPGRQRYYVTIRGFELAPECERYILWDGIEGTDMPSRVVMRAVPTPSCVP